MMRISSPTLGKRRSISRDKKGLIHRFLDDNILSTSTPAVQDQNNLLIALETHLNTNYSLITYSNTCTNKSST
jgi:hypothetical protein